MIGYATDDKRTDGTSGNSRAKNSGKRAVMFGYGVESLRQYYRVHHRNTESDSGECHYRKLFASEQSACQQYYGDYSRHLKQTLAVYELQQNHTEETSHSHQSPEQPNGLRSISLWVYTVILFKESTHKDRRTLLCTYVAKYT